MSNPISIHISISQASGSQFETVEGTWLERRNGGDKRKRIHREEPERGGGNVDEWEGIRRERKRRANIDSNLLPSISIPM